MIQPTQYKLKWDQYMGHGRGITCTIKTEDHETLLVVWRAVCRDKLPSTVRDCTIFAQKAGEERVYRLDVKQDLVESDALVLQFIHETRPPFIEP